ncbi:MAG: acyl-CoA dehydrogenase family protein [Gammaproteobacteria bacterium]|nr:acyl-CoA dehydrogenase family protein [Gammaproteobacteria bacterium]MDE0478830.1 acyl-CoA dehydrogenase family protein [Gammaproteobacteria bacterium]MDE0507265.1 acyl-CoA dehydrogenase family protein [Gammaproteobacteria bacterium]MYA66322.1 acyl-CoA dehydrogenase [Gammaproteobacteria bacterium]MYH45690.1 acyl-CoA dehydrogenase [Gammaproteobacteria bacterium]
MNLGLPEHLIEVREKISNFVGEKVEPVEREYLSEIDVGDRWSHTPRQHEILDGLKQEARAQGLWNFFLPESQGGAGISNLEYAHLAEIMGRSRLASESMNCSAPDTGNMEVLERFGSEEQQKEWLEPLLAGEIRSAFAMTEPDVASSDATNISTRAVLDGGEWVINGEKFYISGAGDARCKIMIVMVVTDPDAPRHNRQSQILVPKDTPGVEIVRPMCVFGHDDAPHGHMHIKFHNVRVPESNIILGRGRGFEISQGRLGPGRIHHCMRSIGAAEKALDLMCKRAVSREAFGKPLAELGGNYDVIADSRIEIEMCRLLVLRAAWLMDKIGNRAARDAISQIKVAVPNMSLRVIDRAMQIHGAAGVSQDFPLASLWTAQRTLRLADGPDEVHRRVIARKELAKYC